LETAVNELPDRIAAAAYNRGSATPFYLIDLGAIGTAALSMRTAWESEFPNAVVAYSYKTNSIAAITRLMRQQGLAAEVVSGAELDLALDDGFTGEAIYFDGPIKLRAELRRAYEVGATIQVDSATEIRDICGILPQNSQSQITLRVSVKRGRRFSRFSFTPEDARIARDTLRLHAIEITGIHFNTGAHAPDTRHFWIALSQWRGFIDELLEANRGVVTIDIGSGFPARSSATGRQLPPFSYYASNIAAAFRRFGWPTKRIRLVVEPGRCLVEDHGYLVTEIRVTKDRGRRRIAVVDAGTNLVRSIASWHHDIVVERPGSGVVVDVAGAQCYESDFFARKLACAPDMTIGHRLVVCAAGGYDIPSANVWTRPSPPIYGIGPDGSTSLICPSGTAIRGVLQ
jgi:diaminopimelate decarboxylase